ncbi:MAG TPA: metal ABC transporter permease [Methylomirabilota bacterium]|nr:metal ABC transporter permease [Methylomirabilota bacterium]
MSLIPAFNFQHIIVEPWTQELSSFGWIALMGFFVATACGLVGNYLILRRMALVGDAISHSVLPGIAIAFLLANSRSSIVMFLGALAAGIVTTVMIEVIHRKSRVKQDAAIGITFSSLFAIGVILISVFASKVDLDQDCVLYGEIGTIPLDVPYVKIGSFTLGPPPLVRMGFVAAAVAILIVVFYKELLISSFDPGLALSVGINPTIAHYGLMAALSVVVVSAFESVGAILVIAMLILPGATASLVSERLPMILGLTVLHAAISSILGIHLALWMECSIAAAMVVMGAVLFALAWVFSPSRGLLRQWIRSRRQLLAPEELPAHRAI